VNELDGLPPRLLWAYRRTRYEAGGAGARPGQHSLAFDGLLHSFRCRTATFIGADNPYSRRMPDGWNQRMRRSLHESARRLHVLPARGVLGAWEEAHLLVLGDPRPAMRLARRFRQNAVVIVRSRESLQIVAMIKRKVVVALADEPFPRIAAPAVPGMPDACVSAHQNVFTLTHTFVC
jgi:hypothetical protein